MAAAQEAPLPPFTVQTLDGVEVQSSELSTRWQWLLIYVQPNCKPCEDIFRAFRRKDSETDLAQKVVIVVGGATVEEANALAARISWLPRSSWYADPSRKVMYELSVKGSPTVFGVRLEDDGKGGPKKDKGQDKPEHPRPDKPHPKKSEWSLKWDLKGVPADTRMLKSILETWCEGLPPSV